MKLIINVFASLNAGGAENRTMDVYRKIDRHNFHFHFVSASLEPNQYFEKEIEELGGKVIKIPSPREIGILGHIKNLIDIFKQYNPEDTVVHSHTLYHSGIVLYAAKKAGIKVRIAHARASNSASKGLKNKIFISIGKILIKKYATHKLAVSEVAGKFLFGAMNDVTIIPNAIDLDRYTGASEAEINNYKKEFGISETDMVFGHIGRLEKEKNHKFIISQFHSFHISHPNSKLLLIGDGTLRKEVEDQISTLRLQDSVTLCGIRRDANRIINIFDKIIFPSFFEGMPGVILEAQAAGIPCICSSNITAEADLGLGIIKFIDLENLTEWENTIRYWKPTIPDLDSIKKAFAFRRLSVESEIDDLKKIYTSNG